MISIKDIDFTKAFGNNLYVLRKRTGLTQEELANDADIPISQVGRIERGEVNTTISTAYVLSKALKIPVSELFIFET